MSMSREELLQEHKTLCDSGRWLMGKKNRDYGADTDPFRNFRRFGEHGILVRMDDKLARLLTFTERGDFEVVSETVEDTVVVLINYAVLFLAYLKDVGKLPHAKDV